jgi:hypothetical protein
MKRSAQKNQTIRSEVLLETVFANPAFSSGIGENFSLSPLSLCGDISYWAAMRSASTPTATAKWWDRFHR